MSIFQYQDLYSYKGQRNWKNMLVGWQGQKTPRGVIDFASSK